MLFVVDSTGESGMVRPRTASTFGATPIGKGTSSRRFPMYRATSPIEDLESKMPKRIDLENPDLTPPQAFFNAIWDFDFVKVIEALLAGRDVHIDDTHCEFPSEEDIRGARREPQDALGAVQASAELGLADIVQACRSPWAELRGRSCAPRRRGSPVYSSTGAGVRSSSPRSRRRATRSARGWGAAPPRYTVCTSRSSGSRTMSAAPFGASKPRLH